MIPTTRYTYTDKPEGQRDLLRPMVKLVANMHGDEVNKGARARILSLVANSHNENADKQYQTRKYCIQSFNILIQLCDEYT